ncbi:MAG: hypothetical protein V9E96_19815 [Chitinophagaceae bacterium]
MRRTLQQKNTTQQFEIHNKVHVVEECPAVAGFINDANTAK